MISVCYKCCQEIENVQPNIPRSLSLALWETLTQWPVVSFKSVLSRSRNNNISRTLCHWGRWCMMRFVSEDNEWRLADPGNELLLIHFCSSGGFYRNQDIFVTDRRHSESLKHSRLLHVFFLSILRLLLLLYLPRLWPFRIFVEISETRHM